MSEEKIKALIRQEKKEGLLSYVDNKGTIDVTQAALFLKSGEDSTEARDLLSELENEGYVENTNADFYHITFEGEKRARDCRRQKAF
jgi:Mn-dependent DtxR family transcriptional regulator